MQQTKLSRLASTERSSPRDWGYVAPEGDLPAGAESVAHAAPIAFLPEYESFRAELLAETGSVPQHGTSNFANAASQPFAAHPSQINETFGSPIRAAPAPPVWIPAVPQSSQQPSVPSGWNGVRIDVPSSNQVAFPAGSHGFGAVGASHPFQAAGAEPGALAYAGFGKRFLAWFIDGIVLFVLALMTTFATISAGIVTVNPDRQSDTAATGDWGFPAVFWAWTMYLVLFNAWGGTLGHRTTGLRVRTTEGAMPGIAAAVIRSGFWVVFTLVASAMAYSKQNGADPGNADEWTMIAWLGLTGLFGLGCLLAIFDKRNQALHDKFAGTIVVTAASLQERAPASSGYSPATASGTFAPAAGLLAQKMLTSGLGFQSAATPNARRYNILYAARIILRAIFRSI